MSKYLDPNSVPLMYSKIETMLAKKQDKLVSGTNIKTIAGNSLLGGGNIRPYDLWNGGVLVYPLQKFWNEDKTITTTNRLTVAKEPIKKDLYPTLAIVSPIIVVPANNARTVLTIEVRCSSSTGSGSYMVPAQIVIPKNDGGEYRFQANASIRLMQSVNLNGGFIEVYLSVASGGGSLKFRCAAPGGYNFSVAQVV